MAIVKEFAVGIGNTDGDYRLVHLKSANTFRSIVDAQAYEILLQKLQARGILPTEYKGQILKSFLDTIDNYGNSDLNQNQLRKDYLLAKLDSEERTILGVV